MRLNSVSAVLKVYGNYYKGHKPSRLKDIEVRTKCLFEVFANLIQVQCCWIAPLKLVFSNDTNAKKESKIEKYDQRYKIRKHVLRSYFKAMQDPKKNLMRVVEARMAKGVHKFVHGH